MNKICTKCNIEKPIEEFVRNKNKKGGYASHCKTCHRLTCIKYYNGNKDKFKERSKTNRLNIRQLLNDIKSKGCIRCGETDIACLDFHHLYNKKDNVSKMVTNENFNDIKEELKKCIILCSNCHRKLHYYKKQKQFESYWGNQ